MGKSIHLSQLLEFFDYKVKESETHASAINSVLGEELAAALMVHFFVNQGYHVTELALPCTTGSNRGFRLDKWISLEKNSEKKSLPKSGKACNFLFWETNRAFYLGSLEDIFDKEASIGRYEYKATGVLGPSDDTVEKMALIQSVQILNGLDYLDNLDNGYFASKLVSLDIFKKHKNIMNFDYIELAKILNKIN
jgi:hypothetical protein